MEKITSLFHKENQKDPERETHENEETRNSTSVVNTEHLKINVGYGIHSQEQSSEILSPETQEVALETGLNNYAERPETIANAYRIAYGGETQYQKLMEAMQDRELPLLFPDAAYKPGGEFVFTAEMLASTAETVFGLKMLQSVGRELTERYPRKYTRREVLKLMAGGIAGAYLATNSIPKILTYPLSLTGGGTERVRDIAKQTEKIHPLNYIFTHKVRNTIIAEKLCWLGENTELEEVSLSIGAAHIGIEDALHATSEERLAFLKSLKPFLKAFFENETLYKIAKLETGPANQWYLDRWYEVPELKDLAS